MQFATTNSTCVYFWLFALFGLGWSQNLSNTSPMKTINILMHGSLEASSTVVKTSCLAPPQPDHGEWRLHPDFCEKDITDCKVPEGTELELGTELIYTCLSPGYKTQGYNVVYCRRHRKWSSIPSCKQIECGTLNSESVIAVCYHSGYTVNCDLPVPPDTQAEVSCRPGYKEEVASSTPWKNRLICNEDGEWDQSPIKCVPDCGRVATNQKWVARQRSEATIGEFPWHVSLYREETAPSTNETRKSFICGGTLILDYVLLTAAHCVYEEKLDTTEDPKKLFVLAGNTYRDYDDPRHDFNIVRNNTVRDVFIQYLYNGLKGEYASDIAVIELAQPFALSETLLPICLDYSGSSALFLDPDVYGKVAGFGKMATLQTMMIPYISYSKCRVITHSTKHPVLITRDKFCAGYGNGSNCEGDGGSGFVFQRKDQWFLLGIASLGIGFDRNAETCDYTLYTRASEYIEWIVESIDHGEKLRNSWLSPKVMSTTRRTPEPSRDMNPPSSVGYTSCLAPPQPTNGQWKAHPSVCVGDENCIVPQDALLEPGSHLVYNCDDGYKVSDNTDVFCERSGRWSSSPVCVEISCSSLNSPSIMADCRSRTGSWISCDPSVSPQTWASLSCRRGYKEYTTITSQANRVFCNEAGKWEPEPIKCVPDCGKAVTHLTPHVVNGTIARVGDFPWHASLYVEQTTRRLNETRKEFICGATLIQPNLLLTAAHCVYNAEAKIEQDPKKLFVMTGNIFRNYDFEWHNPSVVKKRGVKKVYRHCSYYGQSGAFASDIALLELEEPFELSSLLLPACLYPDAHDEQILEYGKSGKVAGFGRTAEGPVSSILQTITVPYIPYHECKTSTSSAEKNIYLISDDKFCAGYTNGSAVCDGDSGGGLVFKLGELWHVMGIVSVGLGVDLDSGEKTCDSNSYTLYTRVSRHMTWIQEIILRLHLNKPISSCDTITSSPFRNRRDSLHHVA